MGDVDSVRELKGAITPRTRIVALSHVSWSTGMTLPIAELASVTHHAGALFICDAAQSCGMVPSRVHELEVDAYACSGQKWLCGPEGTGALYVKRDRLGDIQQTFMGYLSIRAGMSDFEGHFVPPEGALRYEAITINPATAAALTSSVRWIAGEVGWSWIFGRIADLGKLCYDALSRMDDVTILTPRDHMAGLIHFNVANIAPADVVAHLMEQDILARSTPAPAAVRVSLGFYTSEADIERLMAALRDLQA
jgi:L-cysteine/cystine lyase